MFKKNFLKLFSLAILIYPLSFINQILISYFFGTSSKLDAYWFSMSLAMILIIHLQPIKEILVNEFYVLKKSDIIKGNQFLVENLFAWIILLVLSSLLFYTFSHEIVYLIMSDFSKEYFDSYLIFFKFMIVYVNFLFISEILSGILITFGIVIYQNLSKLIIVLSSIIFLLILFEFFKEYTLAYSLITGLFVLVVIQLIDLNKNKIIFFYTPKNKIKFL